MPFSSHLVLVLIQALVGNVLFDETSAVGIVDQVEHSPVHADSLTLNTSLGIMFFNNKPFSGTTYTPSPDCTQSATTQYVNGKKEGLHQQWFPGGQLSYEANYANGRRHGKTYSWWSNGNLRSESNFENGVPHGPQFQYYESGAKFKFLQLVNGREEGVQRSWRKNGKLYNNYEAKNGRIFGLKRSKLCFQLDNEEVQYE